MKRTSLPVFLAVAVLAACATPRSGQQASSSEEGAAGGAAGAKLPPPTEVTEASLRVGGFETRSDLNNVNFDFDSAKLSEQALATLKANADVMKSNTNLKILVTGNCDERGTVAYNLALGQKRAKAVRDYYITIGVDGHRIATISYGKEKPLCNDSSEECWAKNRRAETRASTKSGGTASTTAQ